MGRALYTFENRRSIGSFTINSLAINPGVAQCLATWSLSKLALSALDVIGFKIVADITHPNGGAHFSVVVGGGAADLVGVRSEEAVATVAGLYASPRLEVDISGLFAGGRSMEFVKLFAWYSPGFGVPAGSGCYSLLGSGPAPLVLAALDDDRCIVGYVVNEKCEVLDGIERVIRQFSHDLSYVDANDVVITLAAAVQAEAGSEGSFRVRIGGTPGFNDGAQVAEMTTTSPTWENRKTSGNIINPRALVLVKLTGLVAAGSGPATIGGATITALEAI